MARSHRPDFKKNYQMCSYYFQNLTFYKLKFPKTDHYALVYSYLTYGNLICGNAYKSHIQKLVNIQKKIVRLMTFKSYSEHTEATLNDLKILNLSKLNEYLISSFMFRYFHLHNLYQLFSIEQIYSQS